MNQQELHELIKKVVGDKIDNIKDIVRKSYDYGNLRGKAGKRSQHRKSFFKREFKKQFGIEVEFSDVENAFLEYEKKI